MDTYLTRLWGDVDPVILTWFNVKQQKHSVRNRKTLRALIVYGTRPDSIPYVLVAGQLFAEVMQAGK